MKKNMILVLGVLVVTLCFAGTPLAGDHSNCDRGCLLGIADNLINSIYTNQPEYISASPDLRITQDGEEIALGQGLWETAQAFTDRLTVVDPKTGQIAFTGVAYEGGDPAIVFIRAKAKKMLLTEIEILKVRAHEVLPFQIIWDPENLSAQRMLWEMPIPLTGRRSPRAKMISLADSYFDALEARDPAVTAFHPDCWRSENGLWTINNPPFFPDSCSEFVRVVQDPDPDVQTYSIRDRRYPLVDVSRGLVVAIVIMDMNGTLLGAPLHNTYLVYEIFKIEDNRIRAIHATLKSADEYGQSSAWPE